MVDHDISGSDPNGRATSPALSDVSQLTVLSRSPSPVPDYQEVSFRSEHALPLTPPSTPKKPRALSGRFVSHGRKRSGSPIALSLSKRRSPQEPQSPPSPRSPRTLRSSRKRLEDAVPSFPKPVLSAVVPWVEGRGGCGTLGMLPKEIRQKIYGFAFDTDVPVTVRKCCGPDTTTRERGGCRKHGSRTASDSGRFNILQISKQTRLEALWVVTNQTVLLLEINKLLTKYLVGWRSANLRPALAHEDTRQKTMWTMVARFRHVDIALPTRMFLKDDPSIHASCLLHVVSALCKSWEQHPSVDTGFATDIALHKVVVNLNSVFQHMLPFNMRTQADDYHWEFLVWVCLHFVTTGGNPDGDKIAADAGHTLQRLIAVVGKYRGRSDWKFVAHTQLGEKDEGGREWLHILQADCAKHGMFLEDLAYD